VLIGLVDGVSHLSQLVLIENIAKITKRPSTDKSLYGIAERLAIPLSRLDAFVHVVFKTDLV
jgi:hypothetical protein